jgi:hypothetical protein
MKLEEVKFPSMEGCPQGGVVPCDENERKKLEEVKRS